MAAALLSGCGQVHRQRTTSTFSSLARSAPTRLGAARTASEKTTTTVADPPAPGAAATRLQHEIKRALAHSGQQVGLLVEDVSSGQVLYALRADAARPPASVEKIYTTVAALTLLGPSLELQTTVLGTGTLERGGVWHGNLYLRGGGDPTFGDGAWNQEYEQGYGPTALQLAKQLRQDGIRRVTGHIFADESLFDSDRGGPATKNLPDTPDYGGELSALVYDHGMSTARMPPAVFAAHELALTLRGHGYARGRREPHPANARERRGARPRRVAAAVGAGAADGCSL